MNMAFDIYIKNICKVNEVIAVYNYLCENAKAFDCSIILRSQLVMIVSAFDTYIHRVVINKIMQQYFSNEGEFSIQTDIPLSLSFSMRDKEDDERRKILYDFFSKKLSKDSFQSPRNIEYAFCIVGVDKIWKKLGACIQQSPEDIKGTLSLIVDRRNKIAHESDWDNASRCYTPIELNDIIDCRNFINELVRGIHTLDKEGGL